MTTHITIRLSTPDDAALIARHRHLMFAEDQQFSDADLMEMEEHYKAWVAVKLVSGEYLAWFAETQDKEVVAGVGLWLREWPPILRNYTGRQGYIENVYTARVYRRQGIARQLMTALLEHVKTSQVAYEIELHPTQMAVPLYASLGFEGNTGAMSQWFGPTWNNTSKDDPDVSQTQPVV